MKLDSAIETAQLPKTILGRHLLIELYECDEQILNQPKKLESMIVAAALKAGATVVDSVFHHFNPHGVSGVVVIAESHITVHTWPQHRYAALDVFTCGNFEIPDLVANILTKDLKAGSSQIKALNRGLPDEIEK